MSFQGGASRAPGFGIACRDMDDTVNPEAPALGDNKVMLIIGGICNC